MFFGSMRNATLFIFPIYLSFLGISLPAVGSVYIAMDVMYLVTRLYSGVRSDALGRKRYLLYSAFLLPMAYVLYIVIPSFFPQNMVIAFVIIGFLESFIAGLSAGSFMPLTYDLSAEATNIGSFWGGLLGVGEIGTLVGYIFLTLVFGTNWNYLMQQALNANLFVVCFAFLTAICIARIPLIYLFIPEKHSERHTRSTSLGTAIRKGLNDIGGIKWNLKVLTALVFLYSIIAAPLDNYVTPIYLVEQLDAAIYSYSFLLIGLTIVGILFYYAGGRLADKLNMRKVLGLLFLAVAILDGSKAFATNFYVFAFVWFAEKTMLTLSLAASSAIFALAVREKKRGFDSSIYELANWTAIVAGDYLILSGVYPALGIPALFLIYGAFEILYSLGILFLLKDERKEG
jgi:MFS family permease